MLNTRASINKAVEALALGLPINFEDDNMAPGAGPYPSLAVRILNDARQRTRHLGRQTPLSPAGAHRETLVVECEVRTRSATRNEADHYAGLVRAGLDEQTVIRMTWLTAPDTINPNPAPAGFITFGTSRLDHVQAERQADYKSAFLTWECEVEVPAS